MTLKEYPFKFICISDTQLRLSAPDMRRDPSFLNTILAKLDYVFASAKKLGADAVLHAGDVLDNPNVDPEVVSSLMELLGKYGIPMVCTVGNHDCKHNMVDTYKKKSDLGILGIDYITVLTAGMTCEFSQPKGNSVLVSGYGFNEPETIDLLSGMVPPKDKFFEIALVHATIFGTKEVGGSAWIGAQNIKGPDVAYLGDVHDDPWIDFQHKSGTHSFNVGAVARMTRTEIERKINFLELYIDPDKKDFKYYVREIPCHAGSEVFDVARIEKIVVQNAEAAIAAVAKAKAGKNQDPVEIVKTVSATALNTEGQRIFTPEQTTRLLKTLEMV